MKMVTGEEEELYGELSKVLFGTKEEDDPKYCNLLTPRCRT
jgi:hypothetical protein